MLVTAIMLALPGNALASGGNYTITGGTSAEQAQVHAALNASSFDWNLIPQSIQVQIESGVDSYASPGLVVLDAGLLDAGEFAWGTVQHEFGHQVDFFLLNDAKRALLEQTLGGQSWYYTIVGLAHSAYGCERFASLISWAYWPSPDNALKPRSSADEAGAMPPAGFRALLTQMIGAPNTVLPALVPKVFAPRVQRHSLRHHT